MYTREIELAHYGVKGMKWGVRRYQNADGSLTPAGKKRWAKSIKKNSQGKTFSDSVKNLKTNKQIKDAAKKTYKLSKEYLDLAEKAEKDSSRAWKTANKKAKEYVDKNWDGSSVSKLKGAKKESGNKQYAKWVEGAADEFYVAPKSEKAAKQAQSNYSKQVDSIVDSMLGKYGDMEVTTLNSIYKVKTKETVRSLVRTAIDSENIDRYYRTEYKTR